MSMFLIGQIIGFVALVFSLAIYQFDDRKKILGLSAIGGFLWAVSFYLIGAYTGAVLNLIGGIRSLAFMKGKTTEGSTGVFIVFAVVSIIATGFTWSGYLSLLALFGTLAIALSSAQLKTKRIRKVGLIAPPLWFVYNFITQSYAGMLVEVCVVLSNFVGQYRFDWNNISKSKRK